MDGRRGFLTAGLAIGLHALTAPAFAEDQAAPPAAPHRLPYDESVVSSNEYRGRWVGTWQGEDGRVYRGNYDGVYYGTVNGVDIGPSHPHSAPHYRDDMDAYPEGVQVYRTGPGTTTIVIRPGTVTTTTIYEETVTRQSRAAPRRPQRSCQP